jgi:hypothetical protein
MTPAAASKTCHAVGAPLLEELDSRVDPIDGHQPAELTGVLCGVGRGKRRTRSE